jgi:peptidoglycan hydrolase CwlO-like protein
MSAIEELEQLQKKRTELENKQASLEHKEQEMKEHVRKLEIVVAALLEKKIKAKNAALGKLESTKKDLEKRVKELQENREASLTEEVEEEKEVSTEQVIDYAPALVIGRSQPLQPEQENENRKEEKKRSAYPK